MRLLVKGKRYCPSCQSVLTISDVDAQCTCGCCGGTWLPTLAATPFDALDYDVVTGEPLESFGFAPECPTCSSRLSRRLLRSVGEVGACGSCGGLWVGPGRMDRLKAVLAGADRRPPVHEDDAGSPFVWRTVMMLSALSAAAAWVISARVL